MHGIIVYVTIAVTILEHSIYVETCHGCMEGQYQHVQFVKNTVDRSMIYCTQVFQLTTKALIPMHLQAHKSIQEVRQLTIWVKILL